MIEQYDPNKDYTDFVGAVRGMPESIYHAVDRLSQTAIKKWAIGVEDGLTPSTFKSEESREGTIGLAVHSMLLDGMAEFHSRFVTGGPINERTGKMYGRDTKAFKEWMSEQPEGATFITDEELAAASTMCANVRRDEFANEMISMEGSETELTMFWVEMINGVEIKCKGRIDWLNPGVRILDLKTTNDVSYDGFARSLVQRGWYTQAWWYRRGLFKCGLATRSTLWGWLVIQNTAPYKIKMYCPSQELLGSGMVKALDGMRNYARYMNGGPSFTQIRGYTAIDLPNYAKAAPKLIEQAGEILE